jgi:chorismate mutase
VSKTEIPKKVQKKLAKLRDRIDEADRDLLRALQKRNKASSLVGKLKNEHKLPLVQPDRWKEVVENRVKRGLKMSLHEPFLRQLLELIHADSLRIQNEVRNEIKR